MLSGVHGSGPTGKPVKRVISQRATTSRLPTAPMTRSPTRGSSQQEGTPDQLQGCRNDEKRPVQPPLGQMSADDGCMDDARGRRKQRSGHKGIVLVEYGLGYDRWRRIAHAPRMPPRTEVRCHVDPLDKPCSTAGPRAARDHIRRIDYAGRERAMVWI